MQIFLDNIQTEYLLQLLKKTHSTWWVHNKIISAIEDAQSITRQQDICKHKPAKYIGEKECCVKCGRHYKIGTGFSWSLVQ